MVVITRQGGAGGSGSGSGSGSVNRREEVRMDDELRQLIAEEVAREMTEFVLHYFGTMKTELFAMIEEKLAAFQQPRAATYRDFVLIGHNFSGLIFAFKGLKWKLLGCVEFSVRDQKPLSSW